jgi:hypothetical protein
MKGAVSATRIQDIGLRLADLALVLSVKRTVRPNQKRKETEKGKDGHKFSNYEMSNIASLNPRSAKLAGKLALSYQVANHHSRQAIFFFAFSFFLFVLFSFSVHEKL